MTLLVLTLAILWLSRAPRLLRGGDLTGGLYAALRRPRV